MKIHSYTPEQKIDKELLSNIVSSYKQEEKDISFQLINKSNFHVELVSKENREEEIEKMLQTSKTITSQFMIDKDRRSIGQGLPKR